MIDPADTAEAPERTLGRVVTIDGIVVDVDALVGIAHQCLPSCCTGRTSCCGSYEVCLSGEEVAVVAGGIPAAGRWIRGRDGDRLDNPFESLGDGLVALETDEDGLCVFAYRDRARRTLCSLHSAALAAGVPPLRMKPRCCHLWPLALTAGAEPVLTVMADAMDFPCNRPRRAQKTLHKGIGDIIAAAFGEPFLRQLQSAIHPEPQSRRDLPPGGLSQGDGSA